MKKNRYNYLIFNDKKEIFNVYFIFNLINIIFKFLKIYFFFLIFLESSPTAIDFAMVNFKTMAESTASYASL
jgi:hypothetical protein